jgi:hypothetical protein
VGRLACGSTMIHGCDTMSVDTAQQFSRSPFVNRTVMLELTAEDFFVGSASADTRG